MMFERIRPFVKKELRQIARDKLVLGMLLLIPAFLLVMYGYALNFDVKHLDLAILDQENSQPSRDFYERFLRSEYFDFKYSPRTMSEIDKLMAEHKIQLAIVIPREFSKSLLRDREVAVQVIVDGQESTVAGTAVGYVNAITESYSSDLVVKAMARKGRRGELLPVSSHPRVWFNPDLKSVRFLVPGLMAFILMIVVVISTSLSVVREKERGSLEQITVSPARPVEVILGKTIPYALISLVSSHLVLLLAYLLFGVSVKGSYGWLLLGMVFFLISGLGLGLFISTVAHTQQAAFMLSVLTTMLPTFVLSGFVFPIRNMPLIIQVVTHFIPARYFLFILRSVMLKGVGLGAFWSQMVFLLLFAFLALGVSSVRLGKIIKQG
jgi:ABC-2 type transport system permease protein